MERIVGPRAHRSFMGHLLGIPRKANLLLLLLLQLLASSKPLATPCASLHHSLVLRNRSGSGGYNIFLKDSFSSVADHVPAPPRDPRAAAIRLALGTAA